jgi:hypothetical protein
MSPEQTLERPDDLDARTDVYSLGVVMYEMLTGRPAFDGPSALAVLRKVSDGEPPPLRVLNPSVSEEVAAVCARAMAKDRNARFSSAGAFAEAIQTYLLAKFFGGPEPDLLALPPPRSIRGSRRRPLLLSGVVASLLVAGFLGILYGWRPRADWNAGYESTLASMLPDRGRLLAEVRDQLSTRQGQPDAGPRRDRVKSMLEDLTALLKHRPDDSEALMLRARAYRRVGECLAAIEDLNVVCRQPPAGLDVARERLLAAYQVFVLYLGNLNEPALRPSEADRLSDDLHLLQQRGDDGHKPVANLVEALAKGDYQAAANLALDKRYTARAEDIPDLQMIRADALFQAVEQVYALEQAAESSESKDAKRLEREKLVGAAGEALRRGLDANPSHIGLLFLKANSQQQKAVWDLGGSEDVAAVLKRQRPLFETALNRLRHATLRTGPDTPLARAVLLSNVGRDDPALEQLQDALSARPPVRYLHTLCAWLQLRSPPVGALTPEAIERILNALRPAFDCPVARLFLGLLDLDHGEPRCALLRRSGPSVCP